MYLTGSVLCSSPPPLPPPFGVCVLPPPPLLLLLLPPPLLLLAPSFHQPRLFVSHLDLLSFFVEEASMGAQFSKTAAKGDAAAERPGEAAVASSPSKANGQVKSTWDLLLLSWVSFSKLDASPLSACSSGRGTWPPSNWI